MGLEQPGRRQDPVEGPPATPVLAVDIVELLGTVEAQADEEAVLVKEPAPIVVEENAVGLERVLDPGPRLLVFLLELDRSPEEIEAHEGRLPALPCDRHLGDLVGFEKLPDIGLVDLIRHPEAASRVQSLSFFRKKQ